MGGFCHKMDLKKALLGGQAPSLEKHLEGCSIQGQGAQGGGATTCPHGWPSNARWAVTPQNWPALNSREGT